MKKFSYTLFQKIKMLFMNSITINNKKMKLPWYTNIILNITFILYLFGGWVAIAYFFDFFFKNFNLIVWGGLSSILSLIVFICINIIILILSPVVEG